MNDYLVVEPCNSSGGFEIKLRGKKLDLAKCEIVFSRIGSVVGNSGVVLLAKVDDYAMSVYGSGRMMVKSAGKGKKPKRAEMDALAERVIGALEKEGAICQSDESKREAGR